MPALKSIANLVTGDDLLTQVVVSAGALPALCTLLSSPDNAIQMETCWAISNITADSSQRVQAVIEANLFPPLIHILQNSSNFRTRKEACYAISNATSAGLNEPSQIRYLVSLGCIKPLCNLLTEMDNKTILVSMNAIDDILKIGEQDQETAGPGAINIYASIVEDAGGLITIHHLSSDDDPEIYRLCPILIWSFYFLIRDIVKAFHIMDKYFPEDEDDSIAEALHFRYVQGSPILFRTLSFNQPANAILFLQSDLNITTLK